MGFGAWAWTLGFRVEGLRKGSLAKQTFAGRLMHCCGSVTSDAAATFILGDQVAKGATSLHPGPPACF